MTSIKRKIDETLPALIEKMGRTINPLILNLSKEKDQLLIFYFHGVYATEAEKTLHHVDPQNNVTVAQLDDFIDYFLRYNYRFVTPEQLAAGLEPGHPYLMMTFDDGYFNNSLALASLQRYQVPATFFITTGNVLDNTSYWWDIVYKYRAKAGVSLDAIREEQEHLKKFKYTYINDYIQKNFGPEASVPWSDIDRPFTPDELREFAKSPLVSIGNHTVHHTILTRYNKEEIREELERTNSTLAGITGVEPISVAFPNGNYNALVLKVAREAGFRFAFTVRPIKNQLPLEQSAGEMACLHRFMTRPQNIREYGSFCRVGYHPKLLYDQLKDKAMFYKKLRLLTK